MHATRAPYLQHHKEPFGPYTYTQEKIITRFCILIHRYDYGHIHNQNHHQVVQCKMIIRATELWGKPAPLSLFVSLVSIVLFMLMMMLMIRIILMISILEKGRTEGMCGLKTMLPEWWLFMLSFWLLWSNWWSVWVYSFYDADDQHIGERCMCAVWRQCCLNDGCDVHHVRNRHAL